MREATEWIEMGFDGVFEFSVRVTEDKRIDR